MNSEEVKLPRLKRDWIGRKVRTNRELKNGRFVIPAGKVCTVEDNHAGLALRTEACGECGVALYITRVPEGCVTLLPESPALQE